MTITNTTPANTINAVFSLVPSTDGKACRLAMAPQGRFCEGALVLVHQHRFGLTDPAAERLLVKVAQHVRSGGTIDPTKWEIV